MIFTTISNKCLRFPNDKRNNEEPTSYQSRPWITLRNIWDYICNKRTTLHSLSFQISCPGVWLCPSGYVEITLKTLGYFFKTGPMEPKFPLLAHESFAMEGFFKSVKTLEDLEKAIASELIEIAIWQTGRRLAYYKGSLGRILQSVASHTDCVHILRFGSCIQKQIVVQLLMNPSRNFPVSWKGHHYIIIIKCSEPFLNISSNFLTYFQGVLAPKIEISGRATVRNPGQIYSGYHRDPSEIPLNLPPVEKEEIPHEERHSQIKSLKRQRPVCHAKKMSKY